MRIVIVGTNVLAKKYYSMLGENCIGCVASLIEIDDNSFDAVYIVTPNEHKALHARHALLRKKHVLIPAPLWGNSMAQLDELEHIANTQNLQLFIAGSHRNCTNILRYRDLIDSKSLGEIIYCRLSYSATSAKKIDGSLIDLTPKLLDILYLWFGAQLMQKNFSIGYQATMGEHILLSDFYSEPRFELAANFLAQHEFLQVDIYGVNDSVHDICALKYGDEHLLEDFNNFAKLCMQAFRPVNLNLERWIFSELNRLASEQMLLA